MSRLIFGLPGYRITKIVQNPEHISVFAKLKTKQGRCPDCLTPSTSRHSQYTRVLQDLPISTAMTELHLLTRRFRCQNPNCSRQTFAEQHKNLVPRRVRRTNRLLQNLTSIGLVLGGKPGAGLAQKLQMPVSASTILRLLRKIILPAYADPHVLGVDDWAFRKGVRYGTIVVDLARRLPIALLPSRESDEVKGWLERHKNVSLVVRDRSREYRDANTRGVPQAIQVADRWHLLHNLLETINHHIASRYPAIGQLAPFEAPAGAPEAESYVYKRHYHPGGKLLALQASREARRQALFKLVKQRQAEGVYTTDVARELGLSRQLIGRWFQLDNLPPDRRGRFKRVCKVDPYANYLLERVAAGCTNQSQLWREITAQGFTGTRSLVSRWLRQRGFAPSNYQPKQKRAPILKTKALSWLIYKTDAALTNREKKIWGWLSQDEQLVELRQLAHQFIAMMTNHRSQEWTSWVQSCQRSSVKELRYFVTSLLKDEAAVRATATYPWSNGQTEGHINRLKLIKRQMYGRAKFDLLRIRVLARDGPFLYYW